MVPSTNTHGEPPQFVKWLIWLLRKDTWKKSPVIATVATVIVTFIALSGSYATYQLILNTKENPNVVQSQNESMPDDRHGTDMLFLGGPKLDDLLKSLLNDNTQISNSALDELKKYKAFAMSDQRLLILATRVRDHKDKNKDTKNVISFLGMLDWDSQKHSVATRVALLQMIDAHDQDDINIAKLRWKIIGTE